MNDGENILPPQYDYGRARYRNPPPPPPSPGLRKHEYQLATDDGARDWLNIFNGRLV